MARGTVVFVHAHPDDEAIFTGGTMTLLVEAGIDVALIVATGGQLGAAVDGDADTLAQHRRAETVASCGHLGIEPEHVHMLAFEDSGVDGENPAGLCHLDPDDLAAAIVDCCSGPVAALVSYDERGIYGHPDHIAVHEAAIIAAAALEHRDEQPVVRYESTVDREYLHFVETHVVVEAGLGERPVGRGLASTDLGSPTVLIDTAIDVSSVLERKRAAMAAHASQIPPDAPLFALGAANFAAVYGWEWYRRYGPIGVLDAIDHP